MEKSPDETEKIRSGITRTLFTRPVRHDCYRCLTVAEKKYIEENAGFNGLEKTVFELRCKGMSYKAIGAKIGYHPTYCNAVGARIREKIAFLLR